MPEQNLFLIEYQDAAFSYEDFSPELLKRMENTKSIGWIINRTESYLDLGLERENENGQIKYTKGILIPATAVNKITPLYEK